MAKKITITFLCIFLLAGCNHEKNQKNSDELKKYDETGKLIVYNEETYSKMWLKNKNLDVTVIDTFCINQKARATKDINKGRLIYFGFHPKEFHKMTALLNRYGIDNKEQSRGCTRLGSFEPYCYEYEMLNEINRKFGENFIDSIFKVAQKW